MSTTRTPFPLSHHQMPGADPLPSGRLAVGRRKEPIPLKVQRDADAEETFARAEAARDQGRLEEAARLFGQSAAKWRAAGEVFQATDAYFELGAILLHQGRGGLLADLAARLLELLNHTPLPPGSYAKLRIFAVLMRKGAANPDGFFNLVLELRRHREEFSVE